MAPPLPSATRVYVGTVNPPATLVGYLQNWDYPGTKDISEEDFYAPASFPSITSVGSPSRSVTLRFKYDKTDAGQAILKTNFDLDTPTVIYCSVLIDGTNGEALPGIVSTWGPTGPDPNTLADTAVTIVQQGAPTDIGSGL